MMNNYSYKSYHNNMKKENIIKYGYPIGIVAIVALLGAIFTSKGLMWLESLDKPSAWVPGFIISIIWAIIYSLFAIYSIYLVNKNKLNQKVKTLLILGGFLNVLWCYIFFTMKSLLGGLIFIVFNLIESILLIKEIYKTNKTWGYVLLIYPTWLTIATCLNLATWILN